MARKKSERVKERKQEGRLIYDGSEVIGEVEYIPIPRIRTVQQIEKIKEKVRVLNSVLVTCPDCMKEMQPRSLKEHIKYNRCKGKPVK